MVLARWEEFEQHEESMGHLQQQRQQPPQQFADVQVNNIVTSRPPLSAHEDRLIGAEQRSAAVEQRAPLIGSVTTSSYSSPPFPTKTGISPGEKVREPHWLKQMTNRAHVALSSALGQSVRRYDDLTPPGLRNPGQNVCFLNAIIQAVAHTPSLPDAVFQYRVGNPGDALVCRLGELLEQLAAPVTTNVPLVLDTSEFRTQAAVEFPSGLIQRPFHVPPQRQQDAAECLAWVVDWLHTRMNRVSSQSSLHPPDSHLHRHHDQSAVIIDRLKQKYDVQSWQTTANQRSTAISQIETADGMNSGLYIGSLNTVSEIDWYQHCSSNMSAVNELFTGQLVDMRLCDACRRVAVSTQLFHILPVPIAEPQLLHGLVSLDACLQQFVQVERMGGANGLMCEHCNQFRLLTDRTVRSDSVVALSPVGNHVTPLSPISGGGSSGNLLNDSIGRESQQRTSTPIHPHPRSNPSLLTDCRRRSLVGYLPSCLVIQLMRFSVDTGRQSTKVCLPVVIPLNGLDMSSYVLHNVDPIEAGLSERTEDSYNLYAVCVHLGSDSTTNGHYVAYARCADDGWYCFDDEHVRAVNMEYELTTRLVRENAYLLFYERAFGK